MNKKGDVFFDRIEKWSVLLAQDIALLNKNIDHTSLNESVCMIIRQIIVLKICEDIGVIPKEYLRRLIHKSPIYPEFIRLCLRVEKKIGQSFDFPENEINRLKRQSLKVGDHALKEMFAGLYFLQSSRVFSCLSCETIGEVYEHFLDKTIIIEKNQQAKIVEKKDGKKGQGAFYSPSQIVNYILVNTLKKLFVGKTAKEVESIKVVDPSCGAGVFLLGAYQVLLDWHLKWYLKDDCAKWSKKKEPRILRKSSNSWNLTHNEKIRILRNHIYGVDINPAAVTISRIVLALKSMEENEEEGKISRDQTERLESCWWIDQNIKQGNTIISKDFHDLNDRQLNVSAFDWENEFPDIFERKNPGFDVVIGNPPFVQLSKATLTHPFVIDYIQKKYSSSMGRRNTFGYFIERSLKTLVRKGGYVSFIVPNTILSQEYYQALRKMMLEYRIENLTNFSNPVFKKAAVETTVFSVKKADPAKSKIEINHFDNQLMECRTHTLRQSYFNNTYKNSFNVNLTDDMARIKEKMDSGKPRLKDLVNINQAIALKKNRNASLFKHKNAENYKRVIDGKHIGRYRLNWGGEYLAYDLKKIHSCKRTDIFETDEKLFFRRTGERIIATYDSRGFYALNTLVVITAKPQLTNSIKYILALLNSELMNRYFVTFLKSTKKTFSEIQARQLGQLPIRQLDLSKAKQRARHDKIVALVDQILDCKRKKSTETVQQSNIELTKKIKRIDSGIEGEIRKIYRVNI